MKHKTIAIIGGGIVGSTAAYYLAKAGYDVTLFDTGTGQATKAAAGIICPWFSLRRNKPWYYLVSNGAEFYRKLMSDLDDDGFNSQEIFQVDGTLMIRRKEKRVQQDLKQAKTKREASPSIGQVAPVAPEEVSNYNPLLKSTHPATFVEGGGRVDGEALIQALHAACLQHGGKIEHFEAFLKEDAEGQIQLFTNKQPPKAYDYILASAGAWLPHLLKPLGYQTDIRPQKGQLFILSNEAWKDQHWPVVMPYGTGDIIPFNDGRIIIGASHEDEMGYDLSIDQSELQALQEEASQWLPLLKDIKPTDYVECKVGTRAMTSDYAVLVGQVPETANLWAVSGLGSSGLTSGPFLGYEWSQLVINGSWSLKAEDFPIDNYISRNK